MDGSVSGTASHFRYATQGRLSNVTKKQSKFVNNQRKQVVLLVSLAVGMFGFAYALVPLYAVFCEVTGINGKTSASVAEIVDVAPVPGREVTIQFLGRVGNGMPWEFRPTERQQKVRLGEMNATDYYARNRASQALIGQAVPSVSPGYAAKYLRKVECFCFNKQLLEAGEDKNMPVRFYVDDDLPPEIHTLSLSYTLFKVPAAQGVAGEFASNES